MVDKSEAVYYTFKSVSNYIKNSAYGARAAPVFFIRGDTAETAPALL